MATAVTFTCDSCGKVQEGQKRPEGGRVRRFRMMPPRWDKVFIFDKSFDLCPSCVAKLMAWIEKAP
jgi:hypothetical protein